MRTCPSCGASYGEDSSFCQQDGTPLVGGDDATIASARVVNLGPYRLLELLGEGGMGRVFRAEHVKLGRKVALKMLRPEFAANPEAVRRFFAEARSVNQVAHPNIVEITDFFEAQASGEETFLIMELLEGESLRSLLDREPLPPLAQTLEIASQIVDGLAAVHEAGIVHRDLKPDNVFLVERGAQGRGVKLLDFGIAKLRATDGGPSMVRTVAGAVLGTPEYMSPEQAEGAPRVDHRADIYALGVMLYEMVSGQKPITGASTSETLIKQLTWMPPLPSASGIGGKIPAGLEALIMRSLAKRPEERPADLREVQRLLELIVQGAEAPDVSGADTLGGAGGDPIEVSISSGVGIPNVVPNRTARHGAGIPSLEPLNHVVGVAGPPSGSVTRQDLAGDPAPNEATIGRREPAAPGGAGTRPDLAGDPASNEATIGRSDPASPGGPMTRPDLPGDPASNEATIGRRDPASPGGPLTRPDLAGDPASNEAKIGRRDSASPKQGQAGSGHGISPQRPRKKSGAAFLILGLLLVVGLIAGAGWLALRGDSGELVEADDGSPGNEADVSGAVPGEEPDQTAPSPAPIPGSAAPAATDSVNASDTSGGEAAAKHGGGQTAPATVRPASDDAGAIELPRPELERGQSSGAATAPAAPKPAPARTPSPAPSGGGRSQKRSALQQAGSGTSPAPASAPAPARSK